MKIRRGRYVTGGMRLGLALAALALAVACNRGPVPAAAGGTPAPGQRGVAAPVKLILVYATGVSGELVDCGCPHHPRGGLARRAEMALGLGHANPGRVISLDGGNAFFAAPAPAPVNDELKKRALVMARGLARMGVAAVNAGPIELAAGLAFLKNDLAQPPGTDPVPFISANLEDAHTHQLVFPAYKIVEVGGARIGIFGVSEQMGGDTAAGFREPTAAAQQAIAALKGQVDLIVGLCAMSLHTASDLAKQAPGADVLIVSDRSSSPSPRPLALGNTILAQAGTRGMYIGRMDLTILPPHPAATGLSEEERSKIEGELARVLAQEKILEGAISENGPLNKVYNQNRDRERELRQKLGQAAANFEYENALISLDLKMPEDKTIVGWLDEIGVKARTPAGLAAPTAPGAPGAATPPPTPIAPGAPGAATPPPAPTAPTAPGATPGTGKAP